MTRKADCRCTVPLLPRELAVSWKRHISVVVEVVMVVVVVVSEFSSKRMGLKRERRWRKETVVKGVLAERMSHILPVPSCPR